MQGAGVFALLADFAFPPVACFFRWWRNLPPNAEASALAAPGERGAIFLIVDVGVTLCFTASRTGRPDHVDYCVAVETTSRCFEALYHVTCMYRARRRHGGARSPRFGN